MEKLTQYLLSIGIAVLFPVVVVFGVFTALPDKELPPYPAYVTESRCVNQYNQSTRSNLNACTQAETRDYKERQRQYDEAIRTHNELREENNLVNVFRAELALAVGVGVFILAVMVRSQSKELSAGLVVGASLVVLGATLVIAAQLSEIESESQRLVGSLFTLSGFVVLSAVLAIIERSIIDVRPETVSSGVELHTEKNESALMVLEHDKRV